jgi:hypothetical protein
MTDLLKQFRVQEDDPHAALRAALHGDGMTLNGGLTRQPRKGERIEWDWPTPGGGIVHRIEGNLCWLDFGGRIDPFIWRFESGLNALVRNVSERINNVDTEAK